MESLAFDIFAVDRASEVFRKVGDHASEMGTKFGKVGEVIGKSLKLAFLGAAGLGGAIATAGFEELKKNQVTVAQLGAVITSTGGKAGVTSEQMQKLSDTIQRYSGQSHESIQQSEALLLGFTNIHDAAGANNDILTRATTITADMAARMGGSASDNAIKLGKALNDPVKGLASLARVGVQFTESQKAQVKAMVESGNTMGAQKLILDTLTTKFGGAAQAAGGTFSGQMARLKLAFEDTSASIVSGLLPAATRIASFVTDRIIPAMSRLWQQDGPGVTAFFSRLGEILTTDVAPIMERVGGFIADHATLFKALTVALVAGVGALVVVVEVMKAWAAAQAILNAVMDANPIGIVIIAIAGLAAGLIYAYKHSETFRNIVQTVFKDVSAAASAMYDDVLHPIFTGLKDTWTVAWTVIKTYWDTVGHPMFNALSTVVHDLGVTFGAVWGGISDVISAVWAVVKPIFEAMKQGAQDVIDTVNKVKGFGGGVLHGAESLVPGAGLLDSVLGGGGKSSSKASSSAGNIHVAVHVDGNAILQAIIPPALQYKARNGSPAFG